MHRSFYDEFCARRYRLPAYWSTTVSEMPKEWPHLDMPSSQYLASFRHPDSIYWRGIEIAQLLIPKGDGWFLRWTSKHGWNGSLWKLEEFRRMIEARR